ncbi:MAG: tRNA uridine-5-carboxymethylaminomethyl(34) synthesis GTPase MnmE [Alphaproteobacteria bacterium]|nr:tRNA uridine-5-carboxymethylaminomethyl(34) synthesis GTPase MnmE [Alphaproteobacteria bacterium]
MADTIFALASGQPPSGVAVIRVSGSDAFNSYRALTNTKSLPVWRTAQLQTITEPVSRETLDKALVLLFQNPHSFTGEDIVEYHLHGGRAIIDSVLKALGNQPNHRMAEPGEFTRRAFQNGKMDLTEAEAIADLIHAETELQRAQAFAQMDGVLSNLYNTWREELTKILAYVEAELEFPDEDLPDDILARITPQLDVLQSDIQAHLNDNRRGERLRNGIHVAILGAPNAGKSSLVNALAQRDVAIVSETAGTTRDVIDVHLDIAGYPVILSDTAGLRPDQLGEDAHDKIEEEGIKRALKIAEEADIRVILYDGAAEKPDKHSLDLESKDNAFAVINKADQNVTLKHSKTLLKISSKTGEGLAEFLVELEKHIKKSMESGESTKTPALTRERHRQALQGCLEALIRSKTAPEPELTAEDLRLAIRDLGRITGKVDVEDLLDVVFRDFCIGK